MSDKPNPLIGRRARISLGLSKITDADIQARKHNRAFWSEQYFGDYGKIVDVNGENVKVLLDDGRMISLSADYVSIVAEEQDAPGD